MKIDFFRKMKSKTYADAIVLSLPIINSAGSNIGRLIPVGPWIYCDTEKVSRISLWRQKSMRMFLIQFESSYEKTLSYLKKLSIEREDRIFFLIYDEKNDFIGHVGISNLVGSSAELDNLVRGVVGGDPRLIFYAELSIINWCFKKLRLENISVRALSYNWLVIKLHEEVGFILEEKIPLKKVIENSDISHTPVETKNSNVNYYCAKLKLYVSRFYDKNPWLS